MQRYENYKPSGVKWLGDIPAHWTVTPAKRLFREVSEKNHPDAELLSVTQEFGVVPRDQLEQRVVMPTGQLQTFKLVRADDFVISLRSFQGGIEYSEFTGLVSPAYTILRKQKKANSRYLKHLLKSSPFISELNTAVTGIREGKNISFAEMAYSLLPLPPQDEQDRIVAFLDQKTAEIDAAIAKKERLIELLNEQRQAIIRNSTRERTEENMPTRNSGISWMGLIPKSDRLTRLGFISKIGNGSTPNRAVLGYWAGGEIPWLNSSKVNDFEVWAAEQFITKRAVRECHLPLVKAGSLLVAITGEGKTRGMAAMTKIDTTINQHLAYINVTDPDIDTEFLLYYLTGVYHVLRDESSAQGSTKGAITCSELSKFPVALPTLGEQKKIISIIKTRLTHLERSRSLIQDQIDLLNELKNITISAAVSGKMRV